MGAKRLKEKDNCDKLLPKRTITHSQLLLVTESQIPHSSRRTPGPALTASPAVRALFWHSHLACQALALLSSLDSPSLLPNLPASGILREEKEIKRGKKRKQNVIGQKVFP